jgi:four helix bundle protein
MPMSITDIIWDVLIKWNYLEQDTVGKQLIRSADSIGANIAEGYGRFHYKENKSFLYDSRGRAYETKFCLNKVYKRILITSEIHKQLNKLLKTHTKSLNAFIKTIGNN